MHAENGSVDEALKTDIKQLMAWLLELPSLVGSEAEVVGTRANAGVREDVVNATVLLLGCLEQSAEFGPDGDICLDEGEGGSGWRVSGRVDVAADDRGAKGEEEGDCCEANA